VFPEVSWSVLYAHSLDLSEGPLDGESFFMLALEQGLVDQGVEVTFDPIRPGEADRYNGGYLRPIQLLVPTHQLARARDVLRDFQSAPALSDEDLERQAVAGDANDSDVASGETDDERSSNEYWSST